MGIRSPLLILVHDLLGRDILNSYFEALQTPLDWPH